MGGKDLFQKSQRWSAKHHGYSELQEYQLPHLFHGGRGRIAVQHRRSPRTDLAKDGCSLRQSIQNRSVAQCKSLQPLTERRLVLL